MSPTHLKPSGTLKGTDLGDEYLFYDRNAEQVHSLNGTAREIYLLCDGSRSPEEVARTFAETYQEQHEVAWRDAIATVHKLLALGLVVSEPTTTEEDR